MSDNRIIVVGSTSDYNEIIYKKYGSEVLFLTDINESLSWDGFKPPLADECLTDLTDYNRAIDNLISHMNIFKKKPVGVTCFDCESLPLAARIACRLGLPFSKEESINLCRSKTASTELWQLHGVPCPAGVSITGINDIPKGILTTGLPAVIKPATGSGSELTFLVNSVFEAKEKFALIEQKLALHQNTRMYQTTNCSLEKYISGTEFSCDWILEDGKAQILRIARKVYANTHSFGTTSAYIVPGEYLHQIDTEQLKTALVNGAKALGFTSMLAMTDFIISDGKPCLLEMTPRIGGDCLPWLIEKSSGTDMFRLALDYALGKKIEMPPAEDWKLLCAVRIIADREGVFDHIELCEDDRITYVHVEKKQGHAVALPPNSYDSRILGFLIFRPDSIPSIDAQIEEITDSYRIILR